MLSLRSYSIEQNGDDASSISAQLFSGDMPAPLQSRSQMPAVDGDDASSISMLFSGDEVPAPLEPRSHTTADARDGDGEGEDASSISQLFSGELPAPLQPLAHAHTHAGDARDEVPAPLEPRSHTPSDEDDRDSRYSGVTILYGAPSTTPPRPAADVMQASSQSTQPHSLAHADVRIRSSQELPPDAEMVCITTMKQAYPNMFACLFFFFLICILCAHMHSIALLALSISVCVL